MLILLADRSAFLRFDLLPLPKGPHDDWPEDLMRAARMLRLEFDALRPGTAWATAGPVHRATER